jgi:hypothetical protein
VYGLSRLLSCMGRAQPTRSKATPQRASTRLAALEVGMRSSFPWRAAVRRSGWKRRRNLAGALGALASRLQQRAKLRAFLHRQLPEHRDALLPALVLRTLAPQLDDLL